MGYTNKTPNYALPQWIGRDYPKMADFNAAFALIDRQLGEGGGGGASAPNILHVNGAYNGNVRNGGPDTPFTAIADAVDAAASGAFTVIHVAPGDYYQQEVLDIRGKSRLAVVVDGSGTGTGPGTGVKSIAVSGALRELFLVGVSCEWGAVTLAPSGAQPAVYLRDCFLTGGVTLHSGVHCWARDSVLRLTTADEAVNVQAALHGCRGWVDMAAGGVSVLYAVGCSNLRLLHRRGTAVVTGSKLDELESSAPNEAGCLLALESGSVTPLADYVVGGPFYGPVVKTGGCPYSLGAFLYDEEGSQLAGERVAGGALKASDIVQADGNIGGSTVQDALSELFTSVSDGKAALVADITRMGGQVGCAGDVPTFGELSDGVRGIPAIASALPVRIELKVDDGPSVQVAGHWNRNFLHMLAFLLTGSFDSGAPGGEGRLNLRTITGSVWSFAQTKQLYATGAGFSGRSMLAINGIYAGQGSEPQSPDNISISIIPSATLSLAAMVHSSSARWEEGVFWGSYQRTFQNVTAGDVTVTETALYAYADTTANWLLPERTLLPEPVTLAPGSRLSVTYHIGLDSRIIA